MTIPLRLDLTRHPDSVCEAAERIEVEVEQREGALDLTYIVTGPVADLALPSRSAPDRTDGLWQHTCFEAFLRKGGEQAYREFNFAPSTQWAAYEFDNYRAGMRDADIDPPRIETNAEASSFRLRAALVLPDLDTASWLIGLSAVIEEANGRKSYWALAHPPGKADFHHPSSFAHELP